MTILLENESGRDFSFDSETLIRKVIEKTLSSEACPYETEINVVITTNEEIQRANSDFRGIDKVTDVLSFPAVDFFKPSDFTIVKEAPFNYLNPENNELILGDILISFEKVQEQAKEYGHSEERELGFLIAHSTLHLLGYDHITDEDRILMEAKQESILKSLGIVRDI